MRAKAQDTRANPNSWETQEEEMGHWTPTGVEPKDYDDEQNITAKESAMYWGVILGPNIRIKPNTFLL